MKEQDSKKSVKEPGKVIPLPRASIVRIAQSPRDKTPAEMPSNEAIKRKVDNNPFIKQMRALADAIDQEVKIILKI